MIIYKDIFTGQELCSDSFPVTEVDGVLFEFQGQHCIRKEGEIILPGANASAEEPSEDGTDEAVERGVDIVLNHRLVDMSGAFKDVKDFKLWLKEYLQKLVKRLKEDGMPEDDIGAFKKKLTEHMMSLMKKDRYKTLDFFTSDSGNASDGQLLILEYRDVDGTEVPTGILIKQGCKVEKY